ncbi:MAG: chloride channel protein [Acidimicrobiales bacterium]|nr:chloride channel protein [Acidimicrobiales bacterium]
MPVSQSFREGFEDTRASTRANSVTGASGVARFAIYGALGAVVGLVVATLEWITVDGLLHWLLADDRSLLVMVLAPGVGLTIAATVLHFGGRTDSSTSDSYVGAFHKRHELNPFRLGPKLAAAVATVGGGGALGMEGPSVYTGAVLGQWLDNRKLTVLGRRSSQRILLVAGAAAGVSAIFRAPATGVLFALEAPYRRDIARHALIPALVSSSVSYLVFVFLLGSERLLPIQAAEFSITDEVMGSIFLGIVGGLAARGLAMLFHEAKEMPERLQLSVRLPLVAAILGLAVLAADALVSMPVTLGPAADQITEIVLDPTVSIGVLLGLFALRALATSATLAAGGVGGVFLPLVVQGLLLGRVVGMLFDSQTVGLFPVVGLAAVLGAGYRTPLAAVMFVAETTGRAEFVIPALLATAVSQAMMGEYSVSSGQVGERRGHLEQRLDLPVDRVTIENVGYLSPSDGLLEVVDRLGGSPESPAVPVADTEYRGLLVLHDIAKALHDHGLDATVGDAMRDIPAIVSGSQAMDAARLMNHNDTAAVAVIDAEGMPIGVVSALSLTGLRDLD